MCRNRPSRTGTTVWRPFTTTDTLPIVLSSALPSTTTKGGSSGESLDPYAGERHNILPFGTGGTYSTVTESSVSTPSGPDATTRTRFNPGVSVTGAEELPPSPVTR